MGPRTGLPLVRRRRADLEPVTGIGHVTGDLYKFAEHGPETVTPGLAGGPGGGLGGDPQTVMLLARIADALEQLPAATGHHVGAVINGTASAAMSAAYYGGR